MRFAWLALTVAAACASPGCHSYPSARWVDGAPNPGDLPPGDNRFDCDAAEDARSVWAQKIDGSGHVRGGLVFVRTRRYGSSAPSATVTLLRADGTRALLHVTPSQRTGMLVPSVRQYERPDSHDAPRAVTMQPRSPRGIAFELAWTDSVTRLRLDSDAQWLDIPMSSKADRLILGCSAGEAIFYSVTVDKLAPSPPAEATPATPSAGPP
jgi:hypothetical protein